ncbi:hypothetical protein QRX60_17070 [Amycolatopsis mongoliensis]|uniref:Uncharacterized protein n=1 Tax=Amycolatopsis mongoliensis TaxID=715475 RepID=A0A9Y2JVG0_9PSEU|nr:hypothetical protein [Amycolatopsis sp. 4-36]WIY05471.1 hypothetical protein QRX60_17070 [Amycolatopsis sp. 4-36]
MRTMYDAVTAANITKANPNPQLVAGYIDKIKLEPWSAADWARFPNARKVTIVKKASTNDGHVLDVEPGDATPEQAPGWAAMRRRSGFAYPVIYCNRSTWPKVKAAFVAQRVDPPLYWIATASGRPEIPEGAIAAQYLLDVAPGIDVSAVADYWPGVDPAPANGGPAASTTGVELMERITINPPADDPTKDQARRVFLSGSQGAAVIFRPRLNAEGYAVNPIWVPSIFAWGNDHQGIGYNPADDKDYQMKLTSHRAYRLPGALWADLNFSCAGPFELDIVG